MLEGLNRINVECSLSGKSYYEKKNPCKQLVYRDSFFVFCGETGIRTPGAFQLNGFQDRRNRPLCHLSIKVTIVFSRLRCKGRQIFQTCNTSNNIFLFFFSHLKFPDRHKIKKWILGIKLKSCFIMYDLCIHSIGTASFCTITSLAYFFRRRHNWLI